MRKKHPYFNHSRGSTLLLVLLIVTALSAMVLSTLLVVNRNTERVTAKASEMDATALAQKGVSIGVHPEIFRDDPLLNFRSSERNEGYRVKISTESTRLNINGVLARKDKRLLSNLFQHWGLETGTSDEITDALIDWHDANDLVELNGAEAEEYRELGFEDRPYNKPFLNVEDMRLVRDFHLVEAVKSNWADYFTIFGDRKLDIRHTGKELLAIATESNEATVESYVDDMRGDDGIVGTEDDLRHETLDEALTALNVTTAEEERVRISSRFRLSTNVKRIVSTGYINNTEKEITLVVSQSGQTIRILDHQEKLTYTIKK